MTVDDLRLTHIPAVTAGMLIRRPACEVFQPFADPAVTTRLWFSKSTGMMKPGAVLRWDWEMLGVSAQVRVQEVEEHGRISYTRNDAYHPTDDYRFAPWRE